MEDLICNEPPSTCIFAVVVKDIISDNIPVDGALPTLIPKGYKTWFNGEEYNLTGTVHPESNRWVANIPAHYFRKISREEFYGEIINNFYAI